MEATHDLTKLTSVTALTAEIGCDETRTLSFRVVQLIEVRVSSPIYSGKGALTISNEDVHDTLLVICAGAKGASAKIMRVTNKAEGMLDKDYQTQRTVVSLDGREIAGERGPEMACYELRMFASVIKSSIQQCCYDLSGRRAGRSKTCFSSKIERWPIVVTIQVFLVEANYHE